MKRYLCISLFYRILSTKLQKELKKEKICPEFSFYIFENRER